MFNWLRQRIFKVVLWLSNRFSSRPEKQRVFEGLDKIMRGIADGKESKGVCIPFDSSHDKFIIFSDQHKGAKNGADDFMLCEPNYLAALDYYFDNNYQFIAMGDCEELWENKLSSVLFRAQRRVPLDSGSLIACADLLPDFSRHSERQTRSLRCPNPAALVRGRRAVRASRSALGATRRIFRAIVLTSRRDNNSPAARAGNPSCGR